MTKWTQDFLSSPNEFGIGGNIGWVDQVISLYHTYTDSASNKERIRNDLIWAHEFIHYFQFISTLDGIYWFIRSIQWTDELRISASKCPRNLEMPIIQSQDIYFYAAIKEYFKVLAEEKLFMEGDASVYYNKIETPTSRFTKEDERVLFYPIDNRHLYEGFARINELFLARDFFKWEDITVLFELLRHTEYDWVLLLGMPYAITSCLIDLALMRPVVNLSNYDMRDVLPGWRFIKARAVVIEKNLGIESLQNPREFQETICKSLGWRTPADLSAEILPYAKIIKESMTFNPNKHKLEDIPPEVKRALGNNLLQKAEKGNFSQTHISHIVDLLELRISDPLYLTFLSPSAFITELMRKYPPPVVKTTDGYVGKDLSAAQVGINSSHAIKMDICKQLMTSKVLICPFAKFLDWRLPGDCPHDSTCPGRIPRPDKVIPECALDKTLQTLFNHSLSEI